MNWINNLIDDYYKFLRQKTRITSNASNEWIEISTPFINMYNDSIEIYAKKENGRILLSDDGITLRNLEYNGIDFSRSIKRKEIFEKILINYGINLKGSRELVTEATENNFPQKKLNLVSAISEANDLYVLAKNIVSSVFKEDVKFYLNEQNIVFTPYFISKGSTGLEFTFDFQIAYKKKEILIKAFNTVNKLNLPHFLFTWDDVKQVREKQTEKKVYGLAIINNSEDEIKSDYLDALKNKGADYILWTERNENHNKEKLAA